MAPDGINFQYLQEAEAPTSPSGDLHPAVFVPKAVRSEPRTLHISETCFTLRYGLPGEVLKAGVATSTGAIPSRSGIKYPPFPLAYFAIAVLTSSLLFDAQQMWASNDKGSRPSSGAIEANSASPESQPTVDVIPPKSDKYDVDRIGQRNVGHGVNLYSLERERAMGEAMASVIDRGTKFVADKEVNDYVSRLAQNLARHSDAEVPFTIKIIDSSNHRVFALPGGFLYVDKGLIMDVDNEAEFAGLMAHEIAHVAARHATRFRTRKSAWNVLSIPIVWASGPAALGAQQIAPMNLKKFCRDSENEADLLGVEYQYAAGYDPQAFVEALEKLSSPHSQRDAKGPSGKTSLHDQIARVFANYPPTSERIQKIQTTISTLLPARKDYVLDTSAFQLMKAKLADPPVLRRQHSAENPANGPVLRRPATLESESPTLATGSQVITKGRLTPVFSYLPASRY